MAGQAKASVIETATISRFSTVFLGAATLGGFEAATPFYATTLGLFKALYATLNAFM
jgi:hypothetical protein